jgi:hypothetical protein
MEHTARVRESNDRHAKDELGLPENKVELDELNQTCNSSI